MVDGADDHAAGVDAHHRAGRQVGDGDERLADQRFRLVVLVDAAEDDAVRARAVVEDELEQLFGLGHRRAFLHLHGAEVGLGERLKIHIVLEQRLDLHLGQVDRLHLGLDGGRFRLRGLGLGRVLLLQRLHRGEEQHVADGGRIGEQHHEAVEAEAEAARGGQAVFQREDEVLVHRGVGALRALGGDLLFKALALVDGVVQLREGVAELAGGDEVLKALGKERVIALALGQRRNLDGVIVDEGGLDEFVFDAFLKEQAEALALGKARLRLEAGGLAGGAGSRVVRPVGIIHARELLHRFLHGHARPLAAQVDDLALIGHVRGAADLVGHVFVELLDEVHHAVVVGVGLIHLHGGELGVVARVHALVAEDAAHLVDALEAADDEAL